MAEKTEKKMKECESCGEPFIRERMLERLKSKDALADEASRFCQDCRRKKFAESLVELAHANKK